MQSEVRRDISKLIASGLIRCAYLATAVLALSCSIAATAAPDDGHVVPQRSQPTAPRNISAMRILISSKGTVVASATLDDNESARHFATLLPLNLVLKDHAATEKIGPLVVSSGIRPFVDNLVVEPSGVVVGGWCSRSDRRFTGRFCR